MRTLPLLVFALVISCSGSEDAASPEPTEDSAVVAPDTAIDTHVSTDAVPADTTSADTAPEAPTDPCAGRLVCDDFEKVAPGDKPPTPFVASANKGTVAIDSAHAFSGKNSVRVSVDATTSTDRYRRAYLQLKGAPLLPLPNNMLYGRFMIWTDRIPDKTVHWTYARADGPVEGGLRATYNYGGMGGLIANYSKNSSPFTDCWQSTPKTLPTNKWVCVSFLIDGKNDEERFWLDGVEIPELHVVGMSKTDATCTVKGIDGKWYAPNPFDTVWVGWESHQHDVAGKHDAWIDDVILDDEPVGCP